MSQPHPERADRIRSAADDLQRVWGGRDSMVVIVAATLLRDWADELDPPPCVECSDPCPTNCPCTTCGSGPEEWEPVDAWIETGASPEHPSLLVTGHDPGPGYDQLHRRTDPDFVPLCGRFKDDGPEWPSGRCVHCGWLKGDHER